MKWWVIVILCNLIGVGIEYLELTQNWDKFCKWMDKLLYANIRTRTSLPDRVVSWVRFGGKSDIKSIKDIIMDNIGTIVALLIFYS